MNFRVAKVSVLFLLMAGSAVGQREAGWPPRLPNVGYYQGQSTLYPYLPVYTLEEDGHGQGYGLLGEMLNLPASSPLPGSEQWCKWSDIGAFAQNGKSWFQWKPRIMPPERAEYLGERVCYFEDRGAAKDINEFQRDVP